MAPAVDPNVPPVNDPAATATMALSPHNLSSWGMFIAADSVVQTVMVGLALASLVTWTIWLAKTMQLRTARRRVQVMLEIMAGAESPAEAMRQVERLRGAACRRRGVKERVASQLERSEAAATGLHGRAGVNWLDWPPLLACSALSGGS
jgi:biopolymer transport protein ExbB